jgi:hypothetical protein
LRQALDQLRNNSGGITRLLGVAPARHARHFLEQMGIFAYARLGEDTLEAGTQFFQKLRGRLDERLTDLGFCRQRLRHLQQALAEPADPAFDPSRMDHSPARSPIPGDAFGNVFQGASTVRVVLPSGATHLDQAAQQFLESLSANDYYKLDEAIQAIVLAPLGGLQPVCQKTSDLARIMAAPLIDQTAAFLSERLPGTDVAEAEMSSAAVKGKSVAEHIVKFFEKAAPMREAKGADQTAYLLHPPSGASHTFSIEAQRVIPDLNVVPGSSPTDLTFCREQGFFTQDELQALMPLCSAAYRELVTTQVQSPHSRFDVPEWIPLDS